MISFQWCLRSVPRFRWLLRFVSVHYHHIASIRLENYSPCGRIRRLLHRRRKQPSSRLWRRRESSVDAVIRSSWTRWLRCVELSPSEYPGIQWLSNKKKRVSRSIYFFQDSPNRGRLFYSCATDTCRLFRFLKRGEQPSPPSCSCGAIEERVSEVRFMIIAEWQSEVTEMLSRRTPVSVGDTSPVTIAPPSNGLIYSNQTQSQSTIIVQKIHHYNLCYSILGYEFRDFTDK